MTQANQLVRKATLIHDGAQGLQYGQVMPLDGHADVACLQIDGGNAVAGGVLTLGGAVPANNETVTIGFQVYTWKTALTGGEGLPGEVLIGGDTTICGVNLNAAINGEGGGAEGVIYGEGTVPHPFVTSAEAAGVVTVTARAAGTNFNAIATTETMGDAANIWAGATLVGGTDFVGSIEFLCTLDGVYWAPILATYVPDGTTGSSATGVGIWRFDVAGLLAVSFPISAYTSGVINVRFFHRPKNQG